MKTQRNLSIGGIGLAAGALACVGLMSAGVPAAQAATYYTPDFSSVTTSSTPGSGVWYTDRAAPGGFTASGGILSETVDPNGTLAQDPNTNSFYATQGRDYEVNLSGSVQTASIQLYVPTAWSTAETSAATSEVAGFWGTGVDASNAVQAYPIISFVNDPNYLTTYSYTGSTAPGFYIWNSNAPGDWTSAGVAVNYGGWNTLSYTLDVGTGYTYSVNGVNAGSYAEPNSTSISTVMLEVRNYGTSYTAQWAATPAPIPGSGLLAAVGGLALIGGLALRRRIAKIQ